MSARPPVTFLARLSDVNISAPADGQGLIFNAGLVQWQNVTIPGTSLDTLSDVLIGTPTTGQLLVFSAGSWINYGPLAFTDITGNIAISQIANGAGADATTYHRGDNTWQPIAGAGSITPTTSLLQGDGSGNATATSPVISMGTTGLQSTGTNDGDFLLNWWNTTTGTSVAPGLHLQVSDGYAQIKLMGSSNTGTGIITPDDLWIRQHMTPSGPKKANIVLSTAGDQFLYSNDDGVTLRVVIGSGLAVGHAADPGSGIISAQTGFRIANAASSGKILKANGTNFIPSTETYAAPGTAGNVMRSDGTNWTSATPASGGTVTSITATSPVVVTPTPLTATGVVSLNAAVDLALTAAQTITQSNATTNAVVTGLTLAENSSGTVAIGLGTGITFAAETDSTNSQPQGSIQTAWSTIANATRSAYMDFLLTNLGTSASRIRLYAPGNLNVGNTTDPAFATGGLITANTGFRVGTAASTSGKILKSDGTSFTASTETYAAPGTSGKLMQSDGTNWTSTTMLWPSGTAPTTGKILVSNGTNIVASTPTFPNASATIGKVIKSDGTNWVASTETLATPGASGNVMISDGTNWTSAAPPSASLWINASISAQTGFAADTYLTGSAITIPAGTWAAGGQYRCTFDMAKTAAGTAGTIINIRLGTAGTTSDGSIYSVTLPAGTAAADTGNFTLMANFRTIGASGVVEGTINLLHNISAGGLFTGGIVTIATPTTTSSINTTAATKIGISFNGGTSFSGTVQLVQAEYKQ